MMKFTALKLALVTVLVSQVYSDDQVSMRGMAMPRLGMPGYGMSGYGMPRMGMRGLSMPGMGMPGMGHNSIEHMLPLMMMGGGMGDLTGINRILPFLAMQSGHGGMGHGGDHMMEMLPLILLNNNRGSDDDDSTADDGTADDNGILSILPYMMMMDGGRHHSLGGSGHQMQDMLMLMMLSGQGKEGNTNKYWPLMMMGGMGGLGGHHGHGRILDATRMPLSSQLPGGMMMNLGYMNGPRNGW